MENVKNYKTLGELEDKYFGKPLMLQAQNPDALSIIRNI